MTTSGDVHASSQAPRSVNIHRVISAMEENGDEAELRA